MLDQLIRAEIVRAEPPLGFVHPLVGAAVYGDVPAAERSASHERAIEAACRGRRTERTGLRRTCSLCRRDVTRRVEDAPERGAPMR